jgi:hypothetical protein
MWSAKQFGLAKFRVLILVGVMGTVLLVGLMTGCGASSQGTGSRSAAFGGIDCHVFYRSSPGEGLSEGPAITFTPNGGHKDEAIEFGDLGFGAQYWDDQFEGRSLRVSVTDLDNGEQIATQLYQIDRDKGLVNQFIGGHGFTGLVYVYHPSSGAELQYFCEAREG